MLIRLASLFGSYILRARSSALVLLVVGAMPGCAAPGTASSGLARRQSILLRIVGDISDTTSVRKRADRHLLRQIPANNPARLAMLVGVVTRYGEQPAMKIYAMDELMAADKLLGLGVLARQLPHFEHWRVLIHACALAQDTGDRAMVDPLILSLNRPAHRFTWLQRPEAKAIRAIWHGGLRRCLADKLFHGQALNVRLAALSLLYRLLPRSRLCAMVLGHKNNSDVLISALRWYAERFNYVPHTAEQVAWIEELHGGCLSGLAHLAELHSCLIPGIKKPPQNGDLPHGALFPQVSQASALNYRTDAGDAFMPGGIPPRLMGLLAGLSNPQFYVSPKLLEGEVQRYYAACAHVRRPGPYPGSPDNPNPSLADNAEKLSYCDLLVVKMLYAALTHRSFRADVTRLGHMSRRNSITEEGGLIQLQRFSGPSRHSTLPALHLKCYPSFKQINSGVYVTGPALLLDTPTGLAQFIFHFQKTDNQRYTGPAPGDLRYVRATRCVVVIFTSLSRHSFDTTADFPDGAVLDLGIFKKCRRSGRSADATLNTPVPGT